MPVVLHLVVELHLQAVMEALQVLQVALLLLIARKNAEDLKRSLSTCWVLVRKLIMRKETSHIWLVASTCSKDKRGFLCYNRDKIGRKSSRKSTLMNMKMKYGWLMSNLSMKMSTLACLLRWDHKQWVIHCWELEKKMRMFKWLDYRFEVHLMI